MAIYTVHIDREVTTWDRFTRLVEAGSEAEAREIASRIAAEADRACPDDAGPSAHDPELGDWAVYEVEEAAATDLLIHPVHEEAA